VVAAVPQPSANLSHQQTPPYGHYRTLIKSHALPLSQSNTDISGSAQNCPWQPLTSAPAGDAAITRIPVMLVVLERRVQRESSG